MKVAAFPQCYFGLLASQQDFPGLACCPASVLDACILATLLNCDKGAGIPLTLTEPRRMLHVDSQDLPGHNKAGIHELPVYCIVMESYPSSLLHPPACSSLLSRWQGTAQLKDCELNAARTMRCFSSVTLAAAAWLTDGITTMRRPLSTRYLCQQSAQYLTSKSSLKRPCATLNGM